MALPNKDLYELCAGLKYNFLFKNDINSIHILLNLYDIEDNIKNIFPKYVSIKYLRNRVRRIFKDRKGKQLIAYNLVNLIHEDINRLELLLYIEGYKGGFSNIKYANKLENLTYRYYSLEELYSLKYLFHFETKVKDILNLKEELFKELTSKASNSNANYAEIINEYCDFVIKSKVFSLNKFLDKQLILNYDKDGINIIEDEHLLTKEDLSRIYKEVLKIIVKNGQKLFKDAYWNGINDRVLLRYR